MSLRVAQLREWPGSSVFSLFCFGPSALCFACFFPPCFVLFRCSFMVLVFVMSWSVPGFGSIPVVAPWRLQPGRAAPAALGQAQEAAAVDEDLAESQRRGEGDVDLGGSRQATVRTRVFSFIHRYITI